MPCETFDTLPVGSQLTVLLAGQAPANTWQPPNGDFWGAKFVQGNGLSTDAGIARIENTQRAGGSNHEVRINNLNLCFSANFGQILTAIRFVFAEGGGNLNLMLNRQFRNFAKFQDLHGQVIGGVQVNVLSGGAGHGPGKIEFVGAINDHRWWGHFAIGGQELWIDDFCWE